MATDEHSTELCGERRPFAIAVPCGLAKDHGGDRHIPDPSIPNAGWWRVEGWRTKPNPDHCHRPLPGFGFEPPLCGLQRGHEGECAYPEPVVPAIVCGETFRGDLPPCNLPMGHGGLHHSSFALPTCSAVLSLKDKTYECTLPQNHTERHTDSDGDKWDITWTRPQSARMDAPAVPLTFSRDRRLRALEEFQDAVTARLDALEKNRDHVRATLRSAGDRLGALENGSGRRINIHDFDRTMGRVTASLDAIAPRLVGRGLDRPSEVVAKLDEILKRLSSPDIKSVERCGSVRPYSGSHGRSGEPNPDDLCVKPEGHTDRHMNGTTTWPHLCGSVWARGHHVSCIRNLGHPGDHRNNDNVWMATQSWTDSEDTVERPFTHDQGCERVSWHAVGECCSHPNGVGPNGCAGCGDYRPSEDEGSPTGTR